MRPNIMEARTSILINLERDQVNKLDRAVGLGNRSAYIRWLIDTVDEENIKKELALESKISILSREPSRLNQKILKLEKRNEVLKQQLKAAKEGKPLDLGDLPGMAKVSDQYRKWVRSLVDRGILITSGKELDWVQFRAKDLDISPRELLRFLKEQNSDLTGLEKWVK